MNRGLAVPLHGIHQTRIDSAGIGAKKALQLGNQNPNPISANSAQNLAITITQNVGPDFVVFGYSLRYAANLQTVLCSMKDTQHNREIISGNTQLCTVGILNTLAPINPFLRIDPFILSTGQSVQFYVTNQTGTAIGAGDLALTLFGYQM